MGTWFRRVSAFFQPIALSGFVSLVVVVLAAPGVSTQSPRRRSIEVLNGREVVAGEALVRLKTGARATSLSALDVDANEVVANGLRRVHGRGRSTAALLAALASH